MPKILIIEDDKFLSSILKGRFEKEGYAVSQAFDGEEGLKKMEEKPDLIILDLIMPRRSGFEFLESKSTDPQWSNIPVIVASNLGQESDVDKARRYGVMGYFIKSQTTIDQIAQMIGEVFATTSAAGGQVANSV